MPDWNIREITGLFLKLRHEQISISSLVKGSSISSKAASLTFRLPLISKLALYFARKKSRKSFHFLLLGSKYFFVGLSTFELLLLIYRVFSFIRRSIFLKKMCLFD